MPPSRKKEVALHTDFSHYQISLTVAAQHNKYPHTWKFVHWIAHEAVSALAVKGARPLHKERKG